MNNPRRRNKGRGKATKKLVDHTQSRHIAQLCNNSAVSRRVPRDPPSISNVTTINKILVVDITTDTPVGIVSPTPLRPGIIKVALASPSGVVTYSLLTSWLATTLGFASSADQINFAAVLSSICMNNVSLWGPSSTTANAALFNTVTLEIPPRTGGESGAIHQDSGGRNTRASTGLSPVKRHWANPEDDVNAFSWVIGSGSNISVAGVTIGTLHVSVTGILGLPKPGALTNRLRSAPSLSEQVNIQLPADVVQIGEGIRQMAEGTFQGPAPVRSGTIRTQLQRPPLQG